MPHLKPIVIFTHYDHSSGLAVATNRILIILAERGRWAKINGCNG